MNTRDLDLLAAMKVETPQNQRELAQQSGLSLGRVNKAIRVLQAEGYADAENRLTEKAIRKLEAWKPRHAVILAAGFGLRMIPINREVPKALLEVRGEVLIERQIRQLKEAGVEDISVVTGFMKERFEYLIDDFGVQLIVNPDYASANNLHSLLKAAGKLENCYIVPCDLYAKENPFRERETHSWYMMAERTDADSPVRVNRAEEIVFCRKQEAGQAMIGIAYLTAEDAAVLRLRLEELAADIKYRDSFWEEILREGDRYRIPARLVPGDAVTEINTYEQLRDIDSESDHLKSGTLDIIAGALKAETKDITGITLLKKGMTNRSFLFSCRGKQYIMRIPGEGTDQLIDRQKEAASYRAIRDRDLCDRIVYINPENGYKITEYMTGARVCDAENPEDVRKCMAFLRRFHDLDLQVDHSFDLYGQMEFYESLWQGNPSVFRDYAETKKRVTNLRPFLEANSRSPRLTHIDAVPDNFLFCRDGDGERLLLIDWEYSGMQDPDVDIAMFAIYAMYSREQADALIDAYYPEGCSEETRYKVYGYMAVCGLLWSNWCEFKRLQGIEFGEYALRQYRYAKEYERLVRGWLAEREGT